ncbi:hypothetical protein NIES593_08190 [Hydrococcus rivularis NIES-593]|uniref:Glucose-inhibited division protein A n=1 Tax=Hydrococcus rivularis NIES-593 TaxID=1921803 RepID=A0A1U7HKR4_9CYAN|nr:hypothetical protein [Hydrococcus rivularis]OKH24128.1 hypothetical protein NIES593_08190 [Hydrococcus rivularis NIES-593]
MQKGKIVAIITGAISIFLAVAYLILVQLLDFRGEMVPAPIGQLSLVISHWSCDERILDFGFWIGW